MDEALLQQAFEDLYSLFENADTQSAAILQFLKDKGLASDEELAPHLEQAGRASSVRGVAARARINRLLAAALKPAEKVPEKPPAESAEKSSDAAASISAEPKPKKNGKDTTAANENATGDGKAEQPETREEAREKEQNKPTDKNRRQDENAGKDAA